MLEIRNIAGTTLQLPADQKLTQEITGTLFDTGDVLQGSYSYPFRFPLSENNRKFLHNAHLPEALYQPDIPVHVTVGTWQFPAVLTYRTAGLYADGALLVDLGEIADTIRNTSIRELCTAVIYVRHDHHDFSITAPSAWELANATPGDYPVVFPPFWNPEMVEESFPEDIEDTEETEIPENYARPEIINPFDPLTGEYPRDTPGTTLYSPMIYLTWLIRHLCEAIGYSVTGSLFSDPIWAKAVLFNTQTVPDQVEGKYEILLSRHLPDIPLSTLFKGLRGYIGLSIDANATTRQIRFDTFRSIRNNAAPVHLTGYVPETAGVETPDSQGFRIETYEDNGNPQGLSHYLVGSGKQSVSIEIGTAKMEERTYKKLYNPITGREVASPHRVLLPSVSGAGNLASVFFEESGNYSTYWNDQEPGTIPAPVNNFGLRCLFYYGIRNTQDGHPMPYASSLSYDSEYKNVSKISLWPGEPDDVFQHYQRSYYEFLAFSKRITSAHRLPLSAASKIRGGQPIAFALDNQANGRYILEKFTFELPAEEGFLLGKLESRQITPAMARPNPVELGGAVWVQIMYENYNPPYSPTYSLHADLVVYVWQDGAYTIPATTPSIMLNWVEEHFDMQLLPHTPGFAYKYNPVIIGTENRATAIHAHRTVLKTQAQIYAKVNGTFGFIEQERWKWTIMAGNGYRVRLEQNTPNTGNFPNP